MSSREHSSSRPKHLTQHEPNDDAHQYVSLSRRLGRSHAAPRQRHPSLRRNQKQKQKSVILSIYRTPHSRQKCIQLARVLLSHHPPSYQGPLGLLVARGYSYSQEPVIKQKKMRDRPKAPFCLYLVQRMTPKKRHHRETHTALPPSLPNTKQQFLPVVSKISRCPKIRLIGRLARASESKPLHLAGKK